LARNMTPKVPTAPRTVRASPRIISWVLVVEPNIFFIRPAGMGQPHLENVS
jgi:hypothetical protein